MYDVFKAVHQFFINVQNKNVGKPQIKNPERSGNPLKWTWSMEDKVLVDQVLSQDVGVLLTF